MPLGYNLFAVAVYEIGHSLGFSHSQNKDSIMYRSYKNESSKSHEVLSKEDIVRLQKVYGKPKPKIYDDNGFIVRVKPFENKIKPIIEKK